MVKRWQPERSELNEMFGAIDNDQQNIFQDIEDSIPDDSIRNRRDRDWGNFNNESTHWWEEGPFG